MNAKTAIATIGLLGILAAGCAQYTLQFKRGAAHYEHGRLGGQVTFSAKREARPFCSDGACHPYAKFNSWGNKDKSRLKECLLTPKERKAYRADSLTIRWLSPDHVEVSPPG